MQRRTLVMPVTIIAILVVQVVALLLFPPSSFSPASQEWWLPVLLALMVLIADYQLIFRRNQEVWPWHLLSFAQGFNIISRLMMVWSHSMVNQGGAMVFNTAYVVLSIVAMLVSAYLVWYFELPEVRSGLLRA